MSQFLKDLLFVLIFPIFIIIFGEWEWLDEKFSPWSVMHTIIYWGAWAVYAMLSYFKMDEASECFPLKYKLVKGKYNYEAKVLEFNLFFIPWWKSVDTKYHSFESQNIFGATFDDCYTTDVTYAKKEKALKAIESHKESAKEDREDYFSKPEKEIKEITNEIIKHESLTYNIEIQNTGFNTRGLLFYFKIDLTNNENFLRRYLVPIFIDENNIYQENISNWFEKDNNAKMQTGISSKLAYTADKSIMLAEEILNKKIKEKFSITKLELIKQIEEEQKKFLKYFEDKEQAIKKIAIPREFSGISARISTRGQASFGSAQNPAKHR